jgi:RND family efflux transporter MFP subunit
MRIKLLIACSLLFAGVVSVAVAESAKKADKKQGGPPPMLVAVDEIVQGSAEPMQELVGTVYFSRVSKVAAEVDGLVSSVAVEDGDRVKSGAPLVRLQTDILQTNITQTRNAYEQAVIDMEQGRKDLQRLESLHADNLIADTTYDAQSTRTQGLEKQAASLQAELDRLQLEKKKKVIRAPFAGLVLKREVEKGEWVNVGGVVAVVADDREVDIIVDIPERLVGFLKKGRKISIASDNQTYTGRYIALVPQGDIATRTFSIKIRMKNKSGLMEGMAARASLPSGPKQDGLLVPRDAVINQFGQQVILLAIDGKAKLVPVQVNGYQGMQVAVSGPDLAAGQLVVVKGNERIRDGQPIRF